MSETRVAALYVETGGVYFGLPDVDPWDEARDARLYAGPWPVVAHPPCARWCQLAPLMESMHGYKVGDDGGCFAAALEAVETWGGVLEHPARSRAWSHFGLPVPARQGWSQSFDRPGYATEIAQVAYGHLAQKRTWLYYVGPEPPSLDWSEPEAAAGVSEFGTRRGRHPWRKAVHLSRGLSNRTPDALRDALLGMARSAALTTA